MVGVVDSQSLQKPVEGTELAEEGLPAKTEVGGGSTAGSCWNYILHNNRHRDSCAGFPVRELLLSMFQAWYFLFLISSSLCSVSMRHSWAHVIDEACEAQQSEGTCGSLLTWQVAEP